MEELFSIYDLINLFRELQKAKSIKIDKSENKLCFKFCMIRTHKVET